MTGVLQAMLNMVGDRIRLDAVTVVGGPSVNWTLGSDGQVYENTGGGPATPQYFWVQPASSAGNYVCTWTISSGTVDSPPGAQAPTQLTLGTVNRTWEETSAGGIESAFFTVNIIRVADGVTVASAAIGLEAEL